MQQTVVGEYGDIKKIRFRKKHWLLCVALQVVSFILRFSRLCCYDVSAVCSEFTNRLSIAVTRCQAAEQNHYFSTHRRSPSPFILRAVFSNSINVRLRPALWCVLSLALVNNVLAVGLRKNDVTLEEQGKDPFSVDKDPFSVIEGLERALNSWGPSWMLGSVWPYIGVMNPGSVSFPPVEIAPCRSILSNVAFSLPSPLHRPPPLLQGPSIEGNILLKNLLDAMGGAMGFFLLGYGFAYGGSNGPFTPAVAMGQPEKVRISKSITSAPTYLFLR